MPDLRDGQSIEVQGSGSTRYTITNAGGSYSCTCPAWSFQSRGLGQRSCKHIVKLRGQAAEDARLKGGAPAPARPRAAAPVANAGPAFTTLEPETNIDTSESPGPSPPELMLAHTWNPSFDLSGWWMSEKLNGVRAYWDGKTLWSRLGNQYLAPDWFTACLPEEPLDGELWMGRNQFARTLSVVKQRDRGDSWRAVKFLVFDAPQIKAHFEERMAFCENVLQCRPSVYARPVEQMRCRSAEHLEAEFGRIQALGGAGLLMRKPGSSYEVGRSPSVLEVTRMR